MKTMRLIKKPDVNITLTNDEVDYINSLIRRDKIVKGIQIENSSRNECPICGYRCINHLNLFCEKCGQRIEYIDSDIIPFTEVKEGTE